MEIWRKETKKKSKKRKPAMESEQQTVGEMQAAVAVRLTPAKDSTLILLEKRLAKIRGSTEFERRFDMERGKIWCLHKDWFDIATIINKLKYLRKSWNQCN